MPAPAAQASQMFHRLLDTASPASGAAVMGTGIVSAALRLAGSETLSTILAVWRW
jgi:hypothetical protein